MLAELLNQIWKGGAKDWRKDYKVQRFLAVWESDDWQRASWAFDVALRCLAAESRIADKFFTLKSCQRDDIILITAALVWAGELCDPMTGAYYKVE